MWIVGLVYCFSRSADSRVAKCHMSYLLKGGFRNAIICGITIGIMKGKTRSLDYSSCAEGESVNKGQKER